MSPKALKVLGERIDQMIRGAGWTREKLGSKATIHPERLAMIIKGDAEPTAGEVVNLASAFCCSAAILLDGLGDSLGS